MSEESRGEEKINGMGVMSAENWLGETRIGEGSRRNKRNTERAQTREVRVRQEKGKNGESKKNTHKISMNPRCTCHSLKPKMSQRITQTPDLIRKVKVRITLSFSCTSMFPAFFNGSIC